MSNGSRDSKMNLRCSSKCPKSLLPTSIRTSPVTELLSCTLVIRPSGGWAAYYRQKGKVMPEAPHPHLESTVARLRRIADELSSVQDELCWTVITDDRSAESRRQRLHEVLTLELILDVKASVDRTRQMLRTYIDAMAESVAKDSDPLAQRSRRERVTEMLALMRKRLAHTRDRVRDTFSDHLDSLIEQTIEEEPRPNVKPVRHEAA